MTSFNDKLEKRKYESNIVIKIGSVYYSQKQPDSGLKIDENKVGIVLNVSVSPVKYDILRSSTPITTINFGLLASGTFDSTPNCSCSKQGATLDEDARADATTTTNVNLYGIVSSTGLALTSFDCELICVGGK